MTKAELVEIIALETGISKKDTGVIVNMILENIGQRPTQQVSGQVTGQIGQFVKRLEQPLVLVRRVALDLDADGGGELDGLHDLGRSKHARIARLEQRRVRADRRWRRRCVRFGDTYIRSSQRRLPFDAQAAFWPRHRDCPKMAPAPCAASAWHLAE